MKVSLAKTLQFCTLCNSKEYTMQAVVFSIFWGLLFLYHEVWSVILSADSEV